ncbi:MAG: peptidase and chymotrypsin/Hap [Ilumatobacteraceae bacterium]|nr:peptidase and chymotrypsin/Hap [Ilumatobacteraceae bacterium]
MSQDWDPHGQHRPRSSWAPPNPADRVHHGTVETLPPRRRPRRGGGAALALIAAALLLVGAFALFGGGRGSVGPPAQETASRATLTKGVVDVTAVLGLQNAEAAGTGIVVASSGLVLTNNHVIDGATRITVTVVSTGRSYTAAVVGTDPSEDIAVLRLAQASGLTTARLGDSSTVRRGDAVVALGNAAGRGTLTATAGNVTALDQTITASDQSGGSAETLHHLIEVSADLQPGDSGGPLYDATGKVVGIDSAGTAVRGATQAAARPGYAIPINNALTIARQIESGQASDTITIGTPPLLGVVVEGDGASANGVSGVVVAEVSPGTPAEAIGLTAGDVIVGIDTSTITSQAELSSALKAHKVGDRVTVTWTDASGARHSGVATLIAGPAN